MVPSATEHAACIPKTCVTHRVHSCPKLRGTSSQGKYSLDGPVQFNDIGNVPVVAPEAISRASRAALARRTAAHEEFTIADLLPLPELLVVSEEVRRARAGSRIPRFPGNLALKMNSNLHALGGCLFQQSPHSP
mmetsp:Transcript_4926/g.8554  ORF Transcript_4926/g.8554 Transcript_4926/m.8554 type:complete len:134 (-) Transcript_4926:1041-1442(-)